jgi:hypothetical protein
VLDFFDSQVLLRCERHEVDVFLKVVSEGSVLVFGPALREGRVDAELLRVAELDGRVRGDVDGNILGCNGSIFCKAERGFCGVAGVAIDSFLAPLLTALVGLVSSLVLSLTRSRSTRGTAALVPALLAFFGFEAEVKSINLGLTMGGSEVSDSGFDESARPTLLGDE